MNLSKYSERLTLSLGIVFCISSVLCNVASRAESHNDTIYLATRSGAFDQFGSRDWSQKIAKYKAVYGNDNEQKKYKVKPVKNKPLPERKDHVLEKPAEEIGATGKAE